MPFSLLQKKNRPWSKSGEQVAYYASFRFQGGNDLTNIRNVFFRYFNGFFQQKKKKKVIV